ncbi:MAG TPA: hypothetical protein VMT38_12990 [Terracidiphilus sp.]|nr:hypothetical protein [Terracidiphilus sp.]
MKFLKLLCALALCAPFAAPLAVSAQTAAGPFDGTWTTNMSCEASERMPAYTWTFVSTITNNAYHGQHGEQGGPGYMVMEGAINPDGSAKLHAKGTVQAGKAGLITQMKGNKYDYYVEAKFSGTSGTGKRDEGAEILGRPCSFEFTKQADSATPATPATPPATPPSQ